MIDLLDLDAISADDSLLVGGKALGLARMVRADLPVSCGFCITTASFAASRHTGLDASLASQIDTAYQRLGGGKVAVRSSAVAEDGAATSFAGQHSTFLSVEGAQAVREAIIRCWQHLDSAQAVAYRGQHGLTDSHDAMAVIVQKMVPAEVAGVVFTRDPNNVDSRRMLVEASWGLGESVVSGRVMPDRWTLDHATGNVLSRQIATKTSELTLDGLRDVDLLRQQQSCLDDTQLKDLADLARRVETLFEMDCDIEWAWAEGQFWLLQARPITAMADGHRERVIADEVANLRKRAAPEGTVWSRINLAEVLPTPTPMTWSLLRKLLSGQGGFGRMYRDLGFDPDPSLDAEGVYDLVLGRPYCNLSREPRFYFRHFPLEYPFGALKANPAKAVRLQPELNPARLDWKFWLRLPVVLPSLMLRMFAAERTRQKLTHSIERQLLHETVPPFVRDAKQALSDDLTTLTEATLWERIQIWQQRVLVDFARESLKPTALALLALARLEQRLSQLLGTVRASQAACELMMNVAPPKEFDLVAALRDVSAGKISRDEFLDRFGHRGRNEMELAEPCWNDAASCSFDSACEFGSVQGSAVADDDEPLNAIWQRVCGDRPIALTESLRQEVTQLRTLVRLRETAKHHFMQGYAVIRRLLRELDCRFQLGGGIFYLTTDEIPDLLQGQRLDRLIESRRHRRRLALQVDVPAVIFSDELDSIGRPTPISSASSFQGVSIASGWADGPAIVLDQPGSQLPEPGYILVCPSTDPAWVPLFAGAKGLVMETGGVLSHGAIVAREFGLPAVAGIPGIHRTLKTGQQVRVDGNQGTVTVLTEDHQVSV